ncbi:hypothetical protein Rs2_50245 [Raphanus sativus]|nr:hypothetical protein Rs2_50245 [Raphanus sativus]
MECSAACLSLKLSRFWFRVYGERDELGVAESGLNGERDCSVLEEEDKPGFDGYLAVVQALLNARRSSEGDCYVRRMCVEGIISSVYDYNAVIDCLSKARRTEGGAITKGDVKKVREVVEKLLEHGCRPDVITFSSIIN